LIVTGGRQTRIGAHRGMAEVATHIAQWGFPVFRYDRRGTGDSEGSDTGFDGAEDDLIAATAAFRAACPHIERVIGFAICDGATALMLFHAKAKIDQLTVANPWVIEAQENAPPPEALRAYYIKRLFSLDSWVRAIKGKLSFRKLAGGLAKAAQSSDMGLAEQCASALATSKVPASFLLAQDDTTAMAFNTAYQGPTFAALRTSESITLTTRKTAAHTFSKGGDPEWLAEQIVSVLQSDK
jgi:exosortase A-associated hydrolase 1